MGKSDLITVELSWMWDESTLDPDGEQFYFRTVDEARAFILGVMRTSAVLNYYSATRASARIIES